jgi:predicted nucleic acid-binding Zn ribbon protein
MPEYLYMCGCGYSERVRHGMTEDIVLDCKACGIPMVRKPQLGGVSFKGDGFASKEK